MQWRWNRWQTWTSSWPWRARDCWSSGAPLRARFSSSVDDRQRHLGPPFSAPLRDRRHRDVRNNCDVSQINHRLNHKLASILTKINFVPHHTCLQCCIWIYRFNDCFLCAIKSSNIRSPSSFIKAVSEQRYTHLQNKLFIADYFIWSMSSSYTSHRCRIIYNTGGEGERRLLKLFLSSQHHRGNNWDLEYGA